MTITKFQLTAALAVLSFFAGSNSALAASQIDISQRPLDTVSSQPPLMMMVMSRDEQLFNKAYPDYTDLNDDGELDTTYNNSFDYSGYFDSDLCYTYSSSRFKAASAATDHVCSSKWSGNFLNWATMSRIDLLRYVLYGGRRSTDNKKTVLERSHIPNDLHAWVKVYTGSDTANYTPYSGDVSFCNASFSSDGAPIMRAARGAYSEWAATALNQCRWREEVYPGHDGGCSGADANGSCYDDASKTKALGGSTGDYTVRVEVCDPASSADGKRESFCRKYSDRTTTSYKPAGLLQEYGEAGQMRFGLISGSYSAPRSGGILRRNIGKLAGNTGTITDGCAAGDEINLKNGRFCNQASGTEGVVNTLDRFKLTKWSGSVWSDCNNYSILNRQGQGSDGNRHLNNPGTSGDGASNCSAWGNPVSELYAEALRYISGDIKTAGFSGGADLAGLPAPAWLDPYRAPADGGNPYCANCSILVLSSGPPSFDSDEIPSVPSLDQDAATLTTALGVNEGINGNYLTGRVVASQSELAVGASVNTHEDLCESRAVSDLATVRGICPDIPSMEGSYLMAGLAWGAWITDLRPDLLASDGSPKPSDYKNTVKTYSVALAEALPKFQIPIGEGKITLAPLCQANNTSGAAIADGGWRSCFLGSVSVGEKKASVSPNYVYGRALETDGSAGSFSLVWEDSLWGNDHDNDVVAMLSYCVGSTCTKDSDISGNPGYDICWRTKTSGPGLDVSPVCGPAGTPTVAADEALVRIENLSAYAGNAMLTGFAVSGSNDDGLKRFTLRPGGTDDSILTRSSNPPGTWYAPMVQKFRVGASDTKQLESPLWYAAKYGNFKDLNSNKKPDDGEWDSKKAGEPDNFFLVRDPSKLKAQLKEVFDDIINSVRPAASVATSSARYTSGDTVGYRVSYQSDGWSGEVDAFNLTADGTLDGVTANGDVDVTRRVWSASEQLPLPGSRKIFVAEPSGTTLAAVPFTHAGMSAAALSTLQSTLDPDIYDPTELINYLRGDASKEQSATGCPDPADDPDTCPYRNRKFGIDPYYKLGDILNSSPVVAAKTSYGYAQLPVGVPGRGDAYKTFVAGKSEHPVLYVGSNDGMLHAINGKTNGSYGPGGKELFAFVPNGVIGNLHQLAEPSYLHHYFVDGTPVVGDAYVGGGWKTLLAGSAGAGARSVFVLNVTDPTDTDPTNIFMWEFNSSTDADLGYQTGQGGQVAMGLVGSPSASQWIAAFGNGMNSQNGKAILYVRNLETGASVAKLTVPEGDGLADPDRPNGLAQPVIVDSDGDGVADTIYAGDYQGNMWKFEDAGGTWSIGLGGQPLFRAKDKYGHPQSITTGAYTVANPIGGTMVIFGTGRYSNPEDADPEHVEPVPPTGTDSAPLIETIYGVWDRSITNVSCNNDNYYAVHVSSCAALPTFTRGASANLQQQLITGYNGTGHGFGVDPVTGTATTPTCPVGYRCSTRNPVDYQTVVETSGKLGWYLDLVYPDSTTSPDLLRAERLLAQPTIILGTLLANTFRPFGDTCAPGGQNALMTLDPLSGAAKFSQIEPPGGWPGGVEPPLGASGIDTNVGSPQGSPLPYVSTIIGGGEPPPPLPLCTGDDCPPSIGFNDCRWTLTNADPGKTVQAYMPCGRQAWKQDR